MRGILIRNRGITARRFCSLPVPVLRHKLGNDPAEPNAFDPSNVSLVEEAASYAKLHPSRIRLVRPVKFIYTRTEAPVLYNAGPRDGFAGAYCDTMHQILASLHCEKKEVSWQVCSPSLMSGLELLGSVSHLEPGTRVVGNGDGTRQFAIVDLDQKQEVCSRYGLLPGERIATGLGLCTVPAVAVKLGAFQPVETPEGFTEMKIDESKFIIQSVDRKVRVNPLSLDDWVELRDIAKRLVIRQLVTIDLSRLGSSSNVGLFWPIQDTRFLGSCQMLLRDVSIRTRGCTPRWGRFSGVCGVREIEIVPREDLTELERHLFVEPRWLSYREIVPLCRDRPPAVVTRTLRVRTPWIGPGRKLRPRYWFKLLQKRGPDMKDSDGGYHGFRHVPIHMAMRRKLNKAQRVRYGFRRNGIRR